MTSKRSERKGVQSRKTGKSSKRAKAASSAKQRTDWRISKKSWWYIGGLTVAFVVVILVFWWLSSGPGQPRSTSMPANPADRADMYTSPPEMQIDTSKTYVATIVTAKGDIVAELDAAAAPQTVNNFIFLANAGFYDGLTFHRVVPGFVVQGGDPLGTGGGGPGYTVPAEIELDHTEGAIAMARRADDVNPERASSGSQFYITLAPQPGLDDQYTVFGQVASGMDVVRAIAVGDVIESITIMER